MTRHQTADVLSREIRGWLDPTDDPHSMGRFAGYEIVGIVGHGGMGIVLKGFEASLNRYVAIKILAPRLATNGSARKRFAREAQAAAAVRHDNVIAIHRVDEWHGLPFLVMPYTGGISLQKRIDSDGPLSIEQTLRVGVQIASGLAAAHAQGLIHRDIKPANILLEQGVERVTITDFGLARAADDASLTRTGVIAGTPQYMSPEQAEAKQLDARSDLFSLGSVLYTMATGRPPFRGTGSFEVLKRIVNEPARPMREIEPSVPVWFENIVDRLHSKSPNDRPSSASEVAVLLEECLAHVQQPTTTLLPESLTAVATPRNRNRLPPIGKFIAAAAFAFLLIFTGVLIVLELNKGTLAIESEADDVPIRIMQGEKVVEKLTISTAGKSVRVAAGNYTIEIDGSFDDVVVNGGKVTLKRRQTEVVRILHSPNEARKEFSSSLEKIANLPDDTEIHVVGCYSAANNQPVDVRVEPTGKPIVVALNAYFDTSWNLDIDEKADVRGVILSGYFDQRFSHMVPKDTPTQILTYFPIWKGISDAEKKERVSRCFYVWSPLQEDFGKMQSLISDITERDVTTFQGIYSAKSFVIDGQRGAAEAQVATRWQKLSKRSDRDAQGYRKVLAKLELVRNDDESGLNTEHLLRLNQLMDAYENELSRNGEKATLKPRSPEQPLMNKTMQQPATIPEPSTSDAAHTISGFVMEFRSGTPDVPVCLCDAATGMPVAKDTYKPIVWSKGPGGNPAKEMAIVVSDEKGNFHFENVPDGKYRVIAQKWMGPYKGVFELHGAEIRLLGAVDEITVPRPADQQQARVVPTPLGENTIQFNQEVGNNETFLFLSTAPPEFDPILGLQGLGTSFWKNLIGVNRMPLGKTTVIGAPNKPVYAFLFAADNSPGYAAITIQPPESGSVRLPAEPFVAGWSDGRKTPPPKLAELIEFMKKHELSVQRLLDIPELSNANFKAYQARMQELYSDLSRMIELPDGQSTRVGDLLAADAYQKLMK